MSVFRIEIKMQQSLESCEQNFLTKAQNRDIIAEQVNIGIWPSWLRHKTLTLAFRWFESSYPSQKKGEHVRVLPFSRRTAPTQNHSDAPHQIYLRREFFRFPYTSAQIMVLSPAQPYLRLEPL